MSAAEELERLKIHDGSLGNATNEDGVASTADATHEADVDSAVAVAHADRNSELVLVSPSNHGGEASTRETVGAILATPSQTVPGDPKPDELDGIRAEEIEQEASEHLARRAAAMNVPDGDVEIAARPGLDETDYSVSPPPPLPPRKDSMPTALSAQNRPAGEATHLDTVQRSADATGTEIQSIMDQFANGLGGTNEREIMSPRLERQQPVLMLPPRTSSLEPRDAFSVSPQTTGESASSIPTSRRGSEPVSISGSSLHQVQSEDQASSRSVRAGSIYQPPPPSPEPEPSLQFDFHRFLEQLRHRTADPVARFLRSFLVEFGKKQWMVHEQVKIISDFLEFISKKMSICEVWRTVSDAEFDNAREGMEKLVMNRLYNQTFSPALPPPVSNSPRKRGTKPQVDAVSLGRRGQHQEDVERDEVIAQKIRIYGWISEEHLDIKSMGEKGQKFLTLAQQELLKINTYRAPRDKVICVLNCCKVIFGFLKNAKSDQSADAFVPLLIYTVLRARPEHLVSNVQYIWRFRNQDKLGGEAGYYMSSLMGVVTFIENLDRTNLTISDEEFERHVEQAVSAIAEKNKQQEYEEKTHAASPAGPMQHLSEKSGLSHAEVTPRHSMDVDHASPKKNHNQRLSEKSQQSASNASDDEDAVSGLLRTIQKPLNSIGRMFSDDAISTQQREQKSLRPAATPKGGTTPRALSPAPKLGRNPSADRRRQLGDARQSERPLGAEDVAVRQASAKAAEATRVRAREQKVVVE